MFRRIVVVAVLVLSLPLHGAEIPLGPSDIGPVPSFVLGAVPHGDGFYVLSIRYGAGGAPLLGTRISAAGEILDPRGVVLTPNYESYASYNFRLEEGRLLLVNAWWRQAEKVYEVNRRSIDPDANRVVETRSSLEPAYPWAPSPRNARGETLQITANNGIPVVSFVGSDGIARRPTQLPEAVGVASFMPWGDDEWLILAPAFGGYMWYRISEARRDTPLKQFLPVPSSSFRATAAADGEFAIVYEVTPPANTNERLLTLRIVKPDGSSTTHTLLRIDVRFVTQGSTPEAALARDGEAWLVAHSWSSTASRARELSTWRVSTSVVEMTHDSISDTGRIVPRLVSGTTQNLFLYEKRFGGVYSFVAHAWPRGTTLPPDQPPTVLMVGLPVQTAPDAVATPTGAFAVWREGNAANAIMMRIIGPNGTEPLRLSNPGPDPRAPRVARNGDTYAVAWIELYPRRERVLVRRFDALGNAIDSEPLVLYDLASLPDTARLAIAAEGDGFRVAWHGRSLDLIPYPGPKQTVYTTHIGARGTDFEDPEELTPPSVAASDPVIVSHGAESVVLFRQMSLVESPGIYLRHYTNGVAPKGAGRRVMDGVTFGADARDGEILIASSRPLGKTESCTDAQRFSFSGVALAPAVTVGCSPTVNEFFVPTPSVVRHDDRWWVAPATMNVTHIHELHADGSPGAEIRFFPKGMTVFPDPRFFATPAGPAAVYSRNEPAAEMAERAFLRTFPWPRRRAAR